MLNDHWIGPKNPCLCGSEFTIADYFGSGLVSIGELIGCDIAEYLNVQRWLSNMKKLRSWGQVNEVFDGPRQGWGLLVFHEINEFLRSPTFGPGF